MVISVQSSIFAEHTLHSVIRGIRKWKLDNAESSECCCS